MIWSSYQADMLICFHLFLWALTAAILSETVVTGLRKWRVCDSRSPMYALMLAHLEFDCPMWLVHFLQTTLSLCLCWNRFWSIFFGNRLRTRYECPLYTYLGRQHWEMTECIRKWTYDATKVMFSGWQLVTEDSMMLLKS